MIVPTEPVIPDEWPCFFGSRGRKHDPRIHRIAIRKGAHSICQGQRKSLEEKIQAKQELINALNIRMESEQRELEELFEQKKRKELEAVSDIIEDAGLAPEEVTEVLQQYIESRRANAS